MRKVIIWLAVALCTFMLGFVAAALLWFPVAKNVQETPCPPSQHSEDASALDPNADLSTSTTLPILAYCELVNNPDRYSGKVVRIRATLGGFIHGILFYEENCPGQTAVAIPQSNDEVRRALTEAAGSEYFGHVPLNLIVVGKFEKVTPSNESDLIWHTSPLHFEIMRVEKASKAR